LNISNICGKKELLNKVISFTPEYKTGLQCTYH